MPLKRLPGFSLPSWYERVSNLDAKFREKLLARSSTQRGSMPQLSLIKDYPVHQFIEPGANKDGRLLL